MVTNGQAEKVYEVIVDIRDVRPLVLAVEHARARIALDTSANVRGKLG